ncbi:hypothetical protein Droror1_Dr00018008 [Drosera rotundifolia]
MIHHFYHFLFVFLTLGFRATFGVFEPWEKKVPSITPSQDDTVATGWLNNKAVRKALHAAGGNVAGSWELCSDRITFTHDAGSMIPYHKNLTSQGYHALIFSGDHDMCVSYTGSEAWTRSIAYKIVDEWRPWNFDGQVTGCGCPSPRVVGHGCFGVRLMLDPKVGDCILTMLSIAWQKIASLIQGSLTLISSSR